MDGGRQGAEETRDEGESEASPGTKHGPAVAVADVIGQAVQVPGVTRQLEVNASNTCAEGDDAEGSCEDRNRVNAEPERGSWNNRCAW